MFVRPSPISSLRSKIKFTLEAELGQLLVLLSFPLLLFLLLLHVHCVDFLGVFLGVSGGDVVFFVEVLGKGEVR